MSLVLLRLVLVLVLVVLVVVPAVLLCTQHATALLLHRSGPSPFAAHSRTHE